MLMGNLLMISQHWVRWWLGANRHQAISWTNDDKDPWHHGVTRPQWVFCKCLCNIFASLDYSYFTVPTLASLSFLPPNQYVRNTLRVFASVKICKFTEISIEYCSVGPINDKINIGLDNGWLMNSNDDLIHWWVYASQAFERLTDLTTKNKINMHCLAAWYSGPGLMLK